MITGVLVKQRSGSKIRQCWKYHFESYIVQITWQLYNTETGGNSSTDTSNYQYYYHYHRRLLHLIIIKLILPLPY
jgi:hypothetical protein